MKASVAIDEFIASRDHGEHEQLAPHHYILTLYGLFARPTGVIIPVASVVQLLADLGAEPSSVRSAISRLKKKGVLVSQQAASGKGYALAAELEPHMQAGDERIFSSPSMNIRDPWLLVSFSVPESERQHRHKIRTGLARMGFGTVNAGLYIGPARLQAEAVEYIREHQLWPYIELFTCEPSGLSDIQEKISRWWNWDKLANEYQSFLNSYQHEIEVWQTALRQGTGDPLEAFRLYMPMVTRWRRLPFLDPGLAPELLPDNWVGNTARKLFGDLHRLLSPLSSQHVQQAIPNWKARGTE